jgi:hypothetical protein
VLKVREYGKVLFNKTEKRRTKKKKRKSKGFSKKSAQPFSHSAFFETLAAEASLFPLLCISNTTTPIREPRYTDE